VAWFGTSCLPHPPYCNASQDRTIADDFLKTSIIVPEELNFGEASRSDLSPVLRDRSRLLHAFFLVFFLLGRLGHTAVA
jgi:hypothetical protein